MDTVEELKQYLVDHGMEDAIVLENSDYATAFVGTTHDGRAIYSYTLMAEYLMLHDGMEYDEAIEWIDYNTIRALPYMGPMAPVIMYDIDE